MSKDINEVAKNWYGDSDPEPPFLTHDDKIFIKGEGWTKVSPERAAEIRRARHLREQRNAGR